MKIILISTPRSGSTSLMMGLSESLGLKYYFQPFNHLAWKGIPQSIEYHNCIVKTMIDEIPDKLADCVKFYIDFCKKFDKVILLSRKDLISCAESLGYNLKHYNNYDKSDYWHKEYFYNNREIDIDSHVNYLKKINDKLIEFSEEINLPIDYYEEIFSGDMNSIEYFTKKHNLICDVDILRNHINPINKLRKGNVENNKII